MSAVKIAKKSAFQLKILNLYAQFIRLSKTRPGLLEKVRTEFREASKLDRKEDSLLIDYKVRRARNQLEMFKTSRVSAVKTFNLNKSNTIDQ